MTLRDFRTMRSAAALVLDRRVARLGSIPISDDLTEFSKMEYLKSSKELTPNRETYEYLFRAISDLDLASFRYRFQANVFPTPQWPLTQMTSGSSVARKRLISFSTSSIDIWA